MRPVWRDGNAVQLLVNGSLFFPRVFAEIKAARHEVLIETFILFDDKVGRALRDILITTAQRGVHIEIAVDGYGSPDLSDEFIAGLTDAGVIVRIFGPGTLFFGYRTNVFRRLHRKLVVVDERVAFVGGINYGADHLDDFGPAAKQDYAVRIEGPAVADIHAFLRHSTDSPPRRRWLRWQSRRRPAPPRPPSQTRNPRPPKPSNSTRAGSASVMFVTRDNREHRTDIEHQYRLGIRMARRELFIANAYFFPGYRMLRDIRNAARRGVDVRLILQGAPDVALAMAAARWLYPYLSSGGVQIYEYYRRPLHGKIAVGDAEWSTIGSSNLDPLSLYLNLEANVMVRDAGLATDLREHLLGIMDQHCRLIDPRTLPRNSPLTALWAAIVFHLLRRFPRWAGMLPAHTPRIAVIERARDDHADDRPLLSAPPPAAPAEKRSAAK